MKNLKKITGVILLTIVLSATGIAQEKTAVNDRKIELKKRQDELKTKLNLTADQEAKFIEINKSFAEKLRSQRQEDRIKREMFQKMKALKDEKDTAMKSILNDEQFAKYLELQSERKAEMKARRAEKK